MTIILTFVLFTGLVVWLRSKDRGLGSVCVIVSATYAFSLLCASVMVLVESRESSWNATVFFMAVLLLFILPLMSLKPANTENCSLPEWKPVHTIFAWCVASIGCYSTLMSLPAAVRLLLGGELGATREALYAGEFGGVDLLSFETMIASGVWPAALLCFVFALIAKRSLPLLIALGFGSVAGATLILAAAGRGGLVHLAQQVVVVFGFAWPLIRRWRPDILRYVKIVGVVFVGVALFLTIYMAFARGIGESGTFSVVSNYTAVNTLYSIVIYVGSSIVNFQDFWFIYDDFGENLFGQRTFPVFCGILRRLGYINNFSAEDINVVYKPYYDAYNLEHAVFNGFQRELMMDFGRWGTLAGAAVWALLVKAARFRYERRLDWFSVSSMSFFASVPFLGIFFLSYGELQGNIALVVMLGTIAFFWFTGGPARTGKETPSRQSSYGPDQIRLRGSPVRRSSLFPKQEGDSSL